MSLATGFTYTLGSFDNQTTGSLTIAGSANASGFADNGQLVVTGTLTNVGATTLAFNAGSTTTVAATGTISLGSQDAVVSGAGAVLTNNGSVGSSDRRRPNSSPAPAVSSTDPERSRQS